MSDSPDPPGPGAEPPDPPTDTEAAAPDADADDDEASDEPKYAPDDGLGFGPVPLRYRHDGWTPDRQLAFIETLAECGCVEQAARAVGMSRNAAYALRRRPDACAFRLAWDAATDAAVARLGDAALARAIHGVAVPVFHGGELVGERRHYDERLTMFLLRYRDPERYGRWRDRMITAQHQNGPIALLGYRIARMMRAALALFNAALAGDPAPAPAREWFVPPGGILLEDPGEDDDEKAKAGDGEPAAAAKTPGRA